MQSYEINDLETLCNVVTELYYAYRCNHFHPADVKLSPITLYVRSTERLMPDNGDDDVKVALRSGNITV